MGNFRFYHRLHIFPGLSVNLSKSGPSLTVGMRGAHVTLGHRGVTRTVGIPGTGIYYTSRSGHIPAIIRRTRKRPWTVLRNTRLSASPVFWSWV
jgi:hypothetical protein